MSSEDKIKKMKEEIAKAKEGVIRLGAKKEGLIKKLEELGFTNFDELEAEIRKNKKKQENLELEIPKAIAAIEAEFFGEE